MLGTLFILSQAAAEEEEGGRLYTTRQERREAGIKHEIADWLSVSGLLELEQIDKRFSLADFSNQPRQDDSSATLQLGAEANPLPWMKGEAIYEYDSAEGKHTLDEAGVSFQRGDFELEMGKLYVPFGEYYSHFVSGPLIEFGETRGKGAVLSYGRGDRLDISAFLYHGRASTHGSRNSNVDWGLAVSGSPNELITFDAGFISDLADSKDALLSDEGNRYERRIPGITAGVVFEFEELEVTAEAVSTLGSFREFEADRDAPFAWNVEAAFDLASSVELALRLEGSDELEDEPRYQGGLALTWRARQWATLTAEYLFGVYRQGFASDSEERELKNVHEAGLQLSLAF